MFNRLISLIGEENFNKISTKRILLVGVGGVGSYALEALVRNGFSDITIVDFDNIDITNLNRQLITIQENVGKPKVMEALKRAKAINPDIMIEALQVKLSSDNITSILDNNYDYVIDACDDINVKFLLIQNSLIFDYKLISSMGTAKKMHPEMLSITTLDKTNNDPLARILRKKVRDAKINKKIRVVSSSEVPLNIDVLGSNNLVPSTAGLLCVSYIVNDIIK